MDEGQVIRDAPNVELSLEIDPSLNRVLAPDGTFIGAVREEVSRGLADILRTLGIPGNPSVQVSSLQGNSRHADEFIRVYVNGQRCRYPDELLQRVYSYIKGVPLDPETTPPSILTWLRELSEGEPRADDLPRNKLVDFLSIVCLEIVKWQPAVLLNLIQVEAYVASLAGSNDPSQMRRETWPPEPTWLLPILREVLDLRISIAAKQTVAEILGQQRSREAVIEELIAALRSDFIEIQMTSEYLKEVTTFDPENGPDMFPFLRDAMFSELGLTYPPFRFVPNERLRPNSFAFKVNHLTTLPWIGLLNDQCFVNETQSSLTLLHIQGIAASAPNRTFEGSVIDLSYQSHAEAADLTTWNQLQYLVLCFADTLRQYGSCFLHRSIVQVQLVQLSNVLPALVRAFQTKMSVEQTTRLLRTLASEGIPIRDMRLILERLLDYEYQASDTERYSILDDRPSISGYLQEEHTDYLVSFVRAGMKRQISNKYARGTSTLEVYQVDFKLENLFAGADMDVTLSEEQQERLVKSLANEVNYPPPTVPPPPILTDISVRARLRDAIKSTFPRTSVLAYQELPPDLDIQPVARISLR